MSNIIIVYFKYITHACTLARTNARTHARMDMRAHACTHAHACGPSPNTHTYTHRRRLRRRRRTGCCYSLAPNRDGTLRWRQRRSLSIQINTRAGGPISARFCVFFAYKKFIGRTETRTRDRMYCQAIGTVRDISRHDRARIATYSFRTPTNRQTDRLKENYSIMMTGIVMVTMKMTKL